MKQKILKLFALFLTVSMIGSSKNSICHRKCVDENKYAESSGSISTAGAGYERPLTPSNFLFFY
jgi:hypothetical protein